MTDALAAIEQVLAGPDTNLALRVAIRAAWLRYAEQYSRTLARHDANGLRTCACLFVQGYLAATTS